MNTHTDMSDFLAGVELDEIMARGDSEDLTLPAIHHRPEATPPWHPRLTFDIALNEDPTTLCERYNITKIQLDDLYFVPAFRREVAEHRTSIRENGVTFKQKARVQAEMYLEVLDDIVNDSEISPATRLDAIKSVVKWGELEPKESKAGSNSDVPTFNIQINL